MAGESPGGLEGPGTPATGEVDGDGLGTEAEEGAGVGTGAVVGVRVGTGTDTGGGVVVVEAGRQDWAGAVGCARTGVGADTGGGVVTFRGTAAAVVRVCAPDTVVRVWMTDAGGGGKA